MTRKITRSAASIVAVMALLASAACSNSADNAGETTDRVKLVVGWVDPATPKLLDQSGAFDGASFDAEWAVLGGPSQQLPALYSDAIDLGYVGDTALTFEAANSNQDWSANAELVNFVSWSYTYDTPYPTVVTAVSTESGIDGPEDFPGHTWAFNFGGNAYAQYIASLGKAGLTSNDIEPIQLADVSTVAAAFGRGESDIISTQYSSIKPLLDEGKAKIIWDETDTKLPNLGTLAAKPQTLRDASKGPAIEEFVQRLGVYNKWLQDNPELVQATFQDVFKFDAERAKFQWEALGRWQYSQIDDDLLRREQELSDSFLEAGTLSKAVDVDNLWVRNFNDLAGNTQ